MLFEGNYGLLGINLKAFKEVIQLLEILKNLGKMGLYTLGVEINM